MLFFTAIFFMYKIIRKKRQIAPMIMLIFAGAIQASISTLSFNPAAIDGGDTVTIIPTISSVPEGKLSVCWGLYYDASCEHEINDIRFHRDYSAGSNAVWFTTPRNAGTYYIRTSLHTGSTCGGLMDSYYVHPCIVYPSDADIVLKRDGQESGERIDIHDRDAMQAYGALRFNQSALNNEELSVYERYNYFISFPFDVLVGDIYGIGTVGTHWRICYYDGKGRAEEGFFAERTSNWVMIDDTDSVLHAGQGYLLQLNSIQMASSNEDVWVNGSDVATLYFPALSKIASITTTNETIPALSEAYQCTIDLSSSLGSEGDRRIKDSYWRCIGVPSFTSVSSVEGMSYLYEWNKADNSLYVVSSEEYVLEPTLSYLIQNGNVIIWRDVTKPAGIVAQSKDTDYKEIALELQQNGNISDRTYIRLTDEMHVTHEFDFGRDLSKELNTGKANIYSLLGYERLAANIMPSYEGKITIPIGVVITENGNYTFSLPVVPKDIEVTLLDYTTGGRTKLGVVDYAVELTVGQDDKRFALEIAPIDPIGTRLLTPATGTNNAPIRKVMINGGIYLIKNDHIFDLRGTRIQ